MIPLIEGIVFKFQDNKHPFTVHKVTDDYIEITGQGELTQFLITEFNEINTNNDLIEVK